MALALISYVFWKLHSYKTSTQVKLAVPFLHHFLHHLHWTTLGILEYLILFLHFKHCFSLHTNHTCQCWQLCITRCKHFTLCMMMRTVNSITNVYTKAFKEIITWLCDCLLPICCINMSESITRINVLKLVHSKC